jgi:hypothetical protein
LAPDTRGLVARRRAALALLAALLVTACTRSNQSTTAGCLRLTATPVAGVCPPSSPGTAGRAVGGGPLAPATPPPPAQIARDGGLLWPSIVALPDGDVRVGPLRSR